jgi:hypothetical protein
MVRVSSAKQKGQLKIGRVNKMKVRERLALI